MTDRTLKPGWQVYRFDQIAINVNDRVEPGDTDAEYYVGLEHLDSDSLKIRRWGRPSEVEATKLRFCKGDIIFGRRRAYQRKLGVAEFNGICSAHAMVLRPKTDVVLPEFLPFFMQSDLFMNRALEISVGSLSPTINWRTLAEQEFALPPLAEQRRMTEVLWTAVDTLEANINLIKHTDILFTSFVKAHFEKHLKEYPLCFIPEITKRTTVGIVVKPSDWYVENGKGVPALRSLNILPGRLDFSDIIYISEEGHSIHAKSQLFPGDVVVVRSGRPGDAVAIPDGIGPLNCIDLVIATPKENLLGEYLAAFLNSPRGILQFIAGTAGTAQKHFNVSAFNKLKVPFPPIEVQKTFIDELIEIKGAQDSAERHYRANSQLQKQFLNQVLVDNL